MTLGFRRYLLLASLVVITVVDLGVGLFLERRLRGSLEERFTTELVQDTRAVGEMIKGQVPPTATIQQIQQILDPVADRMGAAMKAHVSIIEPDGVVSGDSERAVVSLGRVDPRVGSTEPVAPAQVTLEHDRLTIVGPVDDGSGRIVRLSVPLTEINDSVTQLRWTLVVTGFVALFAASLVVALASRLLSRNLRTLVISAQREAGLLPTHGRDDRADPPTSVSALADDLRRTVGLLSTERERFETVLETMEQAVLALNPDLCITIINRAGRELLGLPDMIEGRPLLDFVRVPVMQELIDQAARGEPANAEFAYGVSPRRRTIQAQATAPRHGGGTVIVMHDVTELRRLETVRQDFIANVSHELRTPVAVIQANAETLLAGAIYKPDRALVFLDALTRHTRRLGRLVADLLDISRIEAGRFQLEIGAIDVGEMIDRTIAALALEAEQKGTHLRSSLAAEYWVTADDKALEQILFNLISNAIKYTQDAGNVEVDAAIVRGRGDQGDALRVEVRDDGPGIDPRHHQRVFERFYRVDYGRARDKGGTGLGLAIVKHLVEAMGGQVGVEPRRPRGSVFWVMLPIAAELHPHGDTYADSESRAANDPQSAENPHAI